MQIVVREEKKRNEKRVAGASLSTCTGPLKKTRRTAFESTTDDGVTPRNEVARAPRVWRLHHTR
jgi:hypothetical protein